MNELHVTVESSPNVSDAWSHAGKLIAERLIVSKNDINFFEDIQTNL